MYARRFPGIRIKGMSLKQVRGIEGIRVREAYRNASKASGVKWGKRDYKTENWDNANEINRALSYANTILYGICQAAIISLGYSTGLGFIHTGKLLSFVYDIADLYKATVTIPAAFDAVGQSPPDLERTIRIECRKNLHAQKVLSRIPEDIAWILDIQAEREDEIALQPGDLWDGAGATTRGGVNYAKEDLSNGNDYDGKCD